MKIRLLFILTLVFASYGLGAEAQSIYNVSGRIIDAEEGTALELVNITFENRSFWAVSDVNGRFSLKLGNGEYHYEVSYMGYETAKGVLKVNGKDISNFTIKMQASSLALSEVVVTAKESTMGSSSVIDQAALTHLQPKSVEDMLQLIPGSLTKNPSLNGVGQASIREIDGNSNNSLGTAVIVDGAPVSNDATLQVFNSANGLGDNSLGSSSSETTTGKGTDLRSISPDNVESIEVIRGIPSVEYGNLTSGAVIIKTKQGATPLEVKGKFDPNSKMIYAGKGFTLNSGGTVNLSVDYSNSYSDIRFKARGFERITASVGWGHTFFQERPLSVNLKAAGFQNLNSVRVDPQQYDKEVSKVENKGIRLTLNGDWNLRSLLVSNISYNVSLNYSHQVNDNTDFMVLKNGVQPFTSAKENGEHASAYADGTQQLSTFLVRGNYYSNSVIDGKPLDIYAQIKANKSIVKNEDLSSAFKLGLEWKYDANHGNGLTFDESKPPVLTDVMTVRPRAYSDIPAMNTVSAFFENKSIFPIGSTSMVAQAGIRVNQLFIDKEFLDRNDIFTAEPRINAEWKFLNSKNNSLFDNFSVAAGWGMTSKMPPLAYLYPNKAYFDMNAFSHLNPDLAVLTTYIIENKSKYAENTVNAKLEPSTGKKLEFSLNAAAGQFNGTVTFFMEKYHNDFSMGSDVMTFPFRRYKVPAGIEDVYYKNGAVYYKQDGQEKEATIQPDTVFNTFDRPYNGSKTDKMGIEYSLNFGKIPYISTSVVVDGAWLWIKRQSNRNYWSTLGQTAEGYYPYAVLYPGGSGSITQRTNTNIRFITHIPKIRMVFSTAAQIVWGESAQTIYKDADGNDVFYQSTDAAGAQCLSVDPIGYMDYSGNYYAWDTKYRSKEYLNHEYKMVKNYTNMTYFEKESYPGSVIFNFRLTKELGNRMEVSFMANNLFNTRKMYKSKTTGGYSVLTIGQYFGAELKIKI